MASIQVDTGKAFKSPPDFTFPPKYNSSPTISEVITTPPAQPGSLPGFGFPTYPVARDPSPGPTHLPEIMTPITPLDNSIPKSNGPTLLTIPLEIRLQIYHYVLVSHPIHHAHLSPTINDVSKKEEFHTPMLKPEGLSFSTFPPHQLLTTSSSPFSAPKDASTISRIRTTHSPHVQGKIPTGLLSSCKQTYAETHALPFQTSHFAFVSWFWSGVYAARQFSRSLRPWQSSAIRFTSVVVLGRDLWVDGMARLGGGIGGGATSTRGFGGREGKGVGEWRELCALWDGVWGLRLRVKGSVVIDGLVAEVETQIGWNGEGGKWSSSPDAETEAHVSLEREKEKERGILNVQMEWVIDGLLRMKSLRWIELEIEDENVDRDVKLEFCAELESCMMELRNRDDDWMGDVKVVFVEPIIDVDGDGERNCAAGEPDGDDVLWQDL